MDNSIWYYCGRYVICMAITIAVIFGLLFALERFAPDIAAYIFADGGGSSIGFMSVILPPILVGQIFYRKERCRMPSGFGWMLAVLCTALCFAISAALTFGLVMFDPMTAAAMQDLRSIVSEDLLFTAIFVAVFAVIILLITRLFLWAGVRGEIKKMERAAIKAATRP